MQGKIIDFVCRYSISKPDFARNALKKVMLKTKIGLIMSAACRAHRSKV